MVTTHGGVTSVFLLYCISFFRFRVGNRYAAFFNTAVQTNRRSIRRLMQSSPEPRGHSRIQDGVQTGT